MDRHLIILRGVPAAGKSQVANAIMYKLENKDVTRLNLDMFAPDSENKCFELYLENALKYTYVIGELYSGRWHISDPIRWINKFKINYQIHSFVLNVSLDKGYSNCCDPRHGSSHFNLEGYKIKYNRFYESQAFKEFSSKAGIKEIQINAENGDYERIANIILGNIIPKEIK